METLVRLRRGRTSRTVTLTLRTGLDFAGTVAAARVIAAFCRGIRVGLLGSGREPVTLDGAEPREEDGSWIATWEARLPKLPPEAFAPLVDMVRSSISGARMLEIREPLPEALLVVRTFAAEAEATLRELPWKLQFVPADRPRLRFTFSGPPSARAAGLVTEAVDAWTEMVRLGAFPPRGRRSGMARSLRLAWPSPEELLCEMEVLSCSHLAYEALFEALVSAHGEIDLAVVEIGAPAWLFGGLRSQAGDARAGERLTP